MSKRTAEKPTASIKGETFADVTDRANWTMTEEVKTTKAGNVSQIYRVFYKGELYDIRKTKRTYAGHWMEIERGGESRHLEIYIAAVKGWMKDNAKRAESGGDSFVSAERYAEKVEENKAFLAELQERLDKLTEAGPAHDWRMTDGGYAGRPDLMKGNAQALIK